MGAVNGDSAPTQYIAALKGWPLQLEPAALRSCIKTKFFSKSSIVAMVTKADVKGSPVWWPAWDTIRSFRILDPAARSQHMVHGVPVCHPHPCLLILAADGVSLVHQVTSNNNKARAGGGPITQVTSNKVRTSGGTITLGHGLPPTPLLSPHPCCRRWNVSVWSIK